VDEKKTEMPKTALLTPSRVLVGKEIIQHAT